MNYLKTAALALAGGLIAVSSTNIPASANQVNDMLTLQAAQTYAAQHGGYVPMMGGTLPSYLAPGALPAVMPQYGYGYNPYYNSVPVYNNAPYYNSAPVYRPWHHHHYW